MDVFTLSNLYSCEQVHGYSRGGHDKFIDKPGGGHSWSKTRVVESELTSVFA